MNLSPNNPGAEAPEPTAPEVEPPTAPDEDVETPGAEVAPPPIEELGDEPEPEDANEVEAVGVANVSREVTIEDRVAVVERAVFEIQAALAQGSPNRPAGKAQPIESDTLVILVKGPTNIHAKVVFHGQLQEVGAFGLGDVGNAALAAWDALRKLEEKAPQG